MDVVVDVVVGVELPVQVKEVDVEVELFSEVSIGSTFESTNKLMKSPSSSSSGCSSTKVGRALSILWENDDPARGEKWGSVAEVPRPGILATSARGKPLEGPLTRTGPLSDVGRGLAGVLAEANVGESSNISGLLAANLATS